MSDEQTRDNETQIESLGIQTSQGDVIDLMPGPSSMMHFTSLDIYESMFSPCLAGKMIVQDHSNIASTLEWTGNEIISFAFRSPVSGDTTEEGELYVYSVDPIDMPNGDIGTRFFEFSFACKELVSTNWNDDHLQEDAEFMGKISDFVKKLTGPMGPTEIEETQNQIWYRPQYAEYSAIRKDGPQKPLDLLHQLAENAIHLENQHAVNFVFYQDLLGGGHWNFVSIEELLKQSPVKKFYRSIFPDTDTTDADIGGDVPDRGGRITDIIYSKKINLLDLSQTGALSSMYSYFKPKIDNDKVSLWFTSNSRKFYYKVNCKFRDRFPAAVIGWEQMDTGIPRWKYAFVEVYLEFDFEKKKPLFKVKPFDQNPIRSNIKYVKPEDTTDDGEEDTTDGGEIDTGPIEQTEDWFENPMYNSMETGNDGKFSYEEDPLERDLGYEAPGINISSLLWENSCFRIQPIRGSYPYGYDIKGPLTFEDQDDIDTGEPFVIEDDMDITGMFPVVDVKIYWGGEKEKEEEEGEEGEEVVDNGGYRPYYFFSASNVADGECSSYEGLTGDTICKDDLPPAPPVPPVPPVP